MVIRSKEFRWSRGDLADVRRHSKGKEPIWVRARVGEVTGRGLFAVGLEDEKTNFYYWNDVRVVLDPPKEEPVKAAIAPKPLTAKIQEIAKVEKPRPALVQPHPEVKVALVPPPPVPNTTVRSRHSHSPTEIGLLLRKLRLEKRLGQKELAPLLGSSYGVISSIELGDKLASDDLLLKMAEVFDVSLDKLLALRDGTPMPVVPKEEPVDEAPLPFPKEWEQHLVQETKPLSTVVREHYEAKEQATPISSGPPDFLWFASVIAATVPVPTDTARRTSWYEHINGLYELLK
jgi:transcriptional regulator with XRE-family HTH domain